TKTFAGGGVWGVHMGKIVGVAPALLICLSSALASNIGTAISVKTEAAIEQPGETHTLTLGAGVSQNATVYTDQSGSAQLKFIDETLLVIGPSSSIKLAISCSPLTERQRPLF